MKPGDKWSWTSVVLAAMLLVFVVTVSATGILHEIPLRDWFSSAPGRTARKFSSFFAFIGAPIQVSAVCVLPFLAYGFLSKRWSAITGLVLALILYFPAYAADLLLSGLIRYIPVMDSLVLSWLTLLLLPFLLLLLGILRQPKRTRSDAKGVHGISGTARGS